MSCSGVIHLVLEPTSIRPSVVILICAFVPSIFSVMTHVRESRAILGNSTNSSVCVIRSLISVVGAGPTIAGAIARTGIRGRGVRVRRRRVVTRAGIRQHGTDNQPRREIATRVRRRSGGIMTSSRPNAGRLQPRLSGLLWFVLNSIEWPHAEQSYDESSG